MDYVTTGGFGDFGGESPLETVQGGDVGVLVKEILGAEETENPDC